MNILAIPRRNGAPSIPQLHTEISWMKSPNNLWIEAIDLSGLEEAFIREIMPSIKYEILVHLTSIIAYIY